jgi:hypothetical protein
MTELYGKQLPPDFKDNEKLTAAEFNAVKNYWVTDELPDTAEDGDVAFVIEGAAAIAGGKILQVVRVTDTAERTTTSTSFVDAGLSVTITPQRSTSAILLISNSSVNNLGSVQVSAGRLVITDSSNNIVGGNGIFGSYNLGIQNAGTPKVMQSVITTIAYATPATTSATTYKIRFKSDDASNTITLKNEIQENQLYAIEVAA